MSEKRPYIENALKSLEVHSLGDNLEVFGEYPFSTQVEGEEVEFTCEYLRSNEGMTFRLISRSGLSKLLDNDDTSGGVIWLDNRSNLGRELGDVNRGIDRLQDAYRDLLDDQNIFGVLIPIREGSLGPTESEFTGQTFTFDNVKYGSDIWDIEEEIAVARAYANLFTEHDLSGINILMTEVANKYQFAAKPIIDIINSNLLNLYDTVIEEESDNNMMDIDWFSEESIKSRISVGQEDYFVERVIKYPYLTEKGWLYVNLFKVWNQENNKFEVVRTIQSKPDADLTNIEYLRLDSNCTDGVHSLDSHCDCGQQLWSSIDRGLKEDKQIIVIQMADHEGKGWGAVYKGATHRVMREFNSEVNPNNKIGNAAASAALYEEGLGTHVHDRRGYFEAGQAVIKFLGISSVNTALVGNSHKLKALNLAGVKVLNQSSVDIRTDTLTPEAQITLKEKKRGDIINGPNGKVSY